MPFVTVEVIIGNQAFQNGLYYICFSLGLDKVETGYNLLMELTCTHQMLNCSIHIHTGLLLFAVWDNSVLKYLRK